MAISVEALEELRAAMEGRELPASSLDRAIAVGVKGQRGDAWLVLQIGEGRVVSASSHQLDSREDVEDQLGAVVAILATEAVWAAVGEGGPARVILAADQREFDVSGQLSYFIRHVRSIVALLVAFADALSGGSAR